MACVRLNLHIIRVLLGIFILTEFTQAEIKPIVHPAKGDYVVLLHGLWRTRKSMNQTAKLLHKEGFHTICLGYPSTQMAIEEIARKHVAPMVEQECPDKNRRIHFVGHSLGCIVTRFYLKESSPSNLGRVVMMGPPSTGSEIVDLLGEKVFFGKVIGPAGRQLRTDQKGIHQSLGPVTYETGVILGNKAGMPFFKHLLQGPSDGVVSLEKGKVKGMKDLLIVPEGHTFIMRDKNVVKAAAAFLRKGAFPDKRNLLNQAKTSSE